MSDSSVDDSPAVPVPPECPRCGSLRADEEFYGVCSSCSTELRALFDGKDKGPVEAVEYEPKMNVTPNAVASKE